VSAKINELKAEKASTEDNLKRQIDSDIKNLEIKESELKDRLKKIENATEEQLENAKDAFTNAREKYNETLSNLQSKLETTV